MRVNEPDAWKSGFADALFCRECSSPWKNSGYKEIRRNSQYIDGYMAGEEARDNGARHDIR